MLDLFGVPLRDLETSNLRAFLGGAEFEPLHWEAKGGTKPDAFMVRKAVGAFANTNEGGYLLLGVDEPVKGSVESTWRLCGWAFPEEPLMWIEKTVRDGVRPTPRIEAVALTSDKDRHVAVVWVPPVDDPPCINRGTVYERVPGSSIPVKDPQRLQQLYERGAGAHESAKAAAARAARRAYRDAELQRSAAKLGTAREEVPRAGFALGLAPIASAAGVDRRLHRTSFVEYVSGCLQPLLAEGGLGSGRPRVGQSQDATWVQGQSWTERFEWRVRAAWDGSVAVSYVLLEDPAVPRILLDPILAAWQLALSCAVQIGGRGAHYVELHLGGPPFVPERPRVGIVPSGSDALIVRRGPADAPPGVDSDGGRHLAREIVRCSGTEFAWEPEDPVDAR